MVSTTHIRQALSIEPRRILSDPAGHQHLEKALSALADKHLLLITDHHTLTSCEGVVRRIQPQATCSVLATEQDLPVIHNHQVCIASYRKLIGPSRIRPILTEHPPDAVLLHHGESLTSLSSQRFQRIQNLFPLGTPLLILTRVRLTSIPSLLRSQLEILGQLHRWKEALQTEPPPRSSLGGNPYGARPAVLSERATERLLRHLVEQECLLREDLPHWRPPTPQE